MTNDQRMPLDLSKNLKFLLLCNRELLVKITFTVREELKFSSAMRNRNRKYLVNVSFLCAPRSNFLFLFYYQEFQKDLYANIKQNKLYSLHFVLTSCGSSINCLFFLSSFPFCLAFYARTSLLYLKIVNIKAYKAVVRIMKNIIL